MEKKQVIKVVGGCGLLLALGIWVYKIFTKEKKQIVEDQKKIEDEVVQAGGDPEEVVEQVVESVEESDRNFTKALFMSLNSPGSGFNPDLIDADSVIRQSSIIHVIEDENKEGTKRYLKLLFEIPEYHQEAGNYNKITLNTITTALDQAGQYIMAKIFKKKFGEDPAWSNIVVVVGYSYLCREIPGGPIIRKYRYIEIPNPLLEKLYPEGNFSKKKPRAEKFYQDIQTKEGIKLIDEIVGDDIQRIIRADASRKAKKDGDLIVNIETEGIKLDPYEYTYLMYSMGLPLSEGRERFISLSDVTEVLSFLVDETDDESKKWFVIERRGQKGDIKNAVLDSFRYKGILFHAPNKEGEFDCLSRHYCMLGNGHVAYSYISEGYDFEKEERERLAKIAEEKEEQAKEAAKKAAEKAPPTKDALEQLKAAHNAGKQKGKKASE